MSGRSRAVIGFAIVLATGAGVSAAVRLGSGSPPPNETGAKSAGVAPVVQDGGGEVKPAAPEHAPGYEHIKQLYLKYIDPFADAYLARQAAGRKAYYEELDRRREEIEAKGEAAVEAEVRAAKAWRHGMWSSGDQPGRRAVHSSSPVSARVFRKLIEDGVFSAAEVIEVLGEVASLNSGLADEWVPLLEEQVTQRNADCWKRALRILCVDTRSRERHWAAIEEWIENRDREALTLLPLQPFLWRVSPDGTREPVRDERAGALVARLSGEKRWPELRVICAEYLADVGNKEAATEICSGILWQVYDPDGGRPGDPHNEEISALSRARQKAVYVLFRDVRTPEALEQVFNFANIEWAMLNAPATLPDGLAEVSSEYEIREAMRVAQSQIRSLAAYAKKEGEEQ